MLAILDCGKALWTVVTLDYRSPVSTTNTVSSDLEWKPYNKWMTRAMTVIVC